MRRKIIVLRLIGMFLLTGLTVLSAMGKVLKNGEESWIKITKLTAGSEVRQPIIIECEESNDVDELSYSFYVDGTWYRSTKLTRTETFYRMI